MSILPWTDLMIVISHIGCAFLILAFFISIPVSIFWGMPKIIRYMDLNLSERYLENRAELKVSELRAKIRVIESQKEAVRLEKKLLELESSGVSDER